MKLDDITEVFKELYQLFQVAEIHKDDACKHVYNMHKSIKPNSLTNFRTRLKNCYNIAIAKVNFHLSLSVLFLFWIWFKILSYRWIWRWWWQATINAKLYWSSSQTPTKSTNFLPDYNDLADDEIGDGPVHVKFDSNKLMSKWTEPVTLMKRLHTAIVLTSGICTRQFTILVFPGGQTLALLVQSPKLLLQIEMLNRK